jgi:UDP-N-acetylglucosamine--N-acetylmuramyl-(pentapeptide) pyrophosphoryl-undecaprenol N-acetylglucosamine transferase
VAELTACGRPAVLIPYPHAAHNHQERNARALEAVGAAHVILEPQLTGAGLGDVIAGLLRDRPRLTRMAEASRNLGRPDAGEQIARRCLALVEG